MELRNSKTKELKKYLANLGLYEEGMKSEEMKQVMLALEESQLECETTFFENDLERALKESELDYVKMHCDAHSSTMINQTSEYHNINIFKSPPHCSKTPVRSSINSEASPFSSPEVIFETLLVKAIVHHELNWSPPELNNEIDGSFRSKCIQNNDNNDNIIKRKVKENESALLKNKRSRPPLISSPRTCRNDSGIHCEYQPEYLHGEASEDYRSDPSF